MAAKMANNNDLLAYQLKEEPDLPPGFRFHPTDEELITYYLLKKVLDCNFTCRAMAEVDLNKCEPWHLPGKAKMGEKEWYFFSLRDRKYPTGLRTNRATEAGYWKATGKDREIYSSKTSLLVGMKKTLVFYNGRAPKGQKSNWVMHEYRLEGKLAYHYLSRISQDEWVISRVFQKTGPGASSPVCGDKKRPFIGINTTTREVNSPSSLPPLLEPSSKQSHVPCFSTFDQNSLFGLPSPSSSDLSSVVYDRSLQRPVAFLEAQTDTEGSYIDVSQWDGLENYHKICSGDQPVDCMWSC